jgi:DNA-binding CsgD family transcriptional regulator
MTVESDLRKAARLVRAADESLAERKRQRAKAVLAALASGLSVRETAKLAGLSPQQVQNIKVGDPTGRRYGKAR